MEKEKEKLKIQYEQIVDQIAKVRADGIGPTLTIIMHPNEVADVIQDIRFIDCSAYRNTAIVRNGEIGTLLGIPIIVSRNVPEGKVFVVPEIKGIQYGDDFVEQRINPSRRRQVWE